MRHGPKYLLVITILLAGYTAALQHKTFAPPAPSTREPPLAAPALPPTMVATTTDDPAPRAPASRLPLVALVDTERAALSEKKAEPLTVKKQPAIERAAPPPDFSQSFQSLADSANRTTDSNLYTASSPAPTPDGSFAENRPESGQDAGTAGAKAKPADPMPAEKKEAPADGEPTDSRTPAASGKAAAPKPPATDRKGSGTRTSEPSQAADSKPLTDRKSGEKSARNHKKHTDNRAKNQDDSKPREPAEAKPTDVKVTEAKKEAAPRQAASSARRHRIAPGDTLERLAEEYWDDRSRAPELYQANENLLPDPRLLPIGVEIAIPARATVTTNRQLADASEASSEPDDSPEGPVPVPHDMHPLPPVEQ